MDDQSGEPIVVHVEQSGERPWCHACGGRSRVKDRDEVALVDLPCFGRPARLCWHKFRLRCPDPDCEMGSWTWEDPRIAATRQVMTDRAGRWATWQVGKLGRTVAEVARELGCDWHTINDTVIAYGSGLLDDPDRFGEVIALGLDETLFCRRGHWRRQEFCTSIVDVTPGSGDLILDHPLAQGCNSRRHRREGRLHHLDPSVDNKPAAGHHRVTMDVQPSHPTPNRLHLLIPRS